MATAVPTTPAPFAANPQTLALLAKFFPRWRGDASEPAISPAPSHKPAPAARMLEMA